MTNERITLLTKLLAISLMATTTLTALAAPALAAPSAEVQKVREALDSNQGVASNCRTNVNCFYHGLFQGQAIDLVHVPNVTVEALPDAAAVGQLTRFDTDSSYYSCLNGETITVWTAPSEFPDDFVVHNGDQGSQCVYGTWLSPQGPTYTGTFRGRSVRLVHVPNVSVEDLADARPAGQLRDLDTTDSYYSCLDKQALNAWMAPAQFPDDIVIHNGDQGPQCTYGTWLLPRA